MTAFRLSTRVRRIRFENPQLKNNVYKVSKNRLDDFLSAICKDRVVYAHEQDKDQYHLVRANEWKPGKHTIAPYRAVEPLKSCIFRSREMLGSLTKHREAPDLPDAIAIGVKNCDLSALKIHDYVFLKSDPVDPFYACLLYTSPSPRD